MDTIHYTDYTCTSCLGISEKRLMCSNGHVDSASLRTIPCISLGISEKRLMCSNGHVDSASLRTIPCISPTMRTSWSYFEIELNTITVTPDSGRHLVVKIYTYLYIHEEIIIKPKDYI